MSDSECFCDYIFTGVIVRMMKAGKNAAAKEVEEESAAKKGEEQMTRKEFEEEVVMGKANRCH